MAVRHLRRPLIAALVAALVMLALGYAATRGEVRNAAFGRRLEDGAPIAWQLLGLRSGDPTVRVEAFRRLAAMRGPRIASMLPGLLRDPSPAVRQPALEMAAEVGTPRLTPALVGLLTGGSPTERQLAASALAKAGDPRAFPALRRALDDPAQPVREEAARALGALGNREAIPRLIGMVHGGGPGVVPAAVALGELRATEAVPELIRGRVPGGDLVWWRLEPLAEIGGPVAGEFLCRQAAAGRTNAQSALASHPERSAGALVSWLERPGASAQMRRRCAELLGRARTREAVPGLVRLLREGTAEEAQVAALSLGQIGDPKAVAPLMAILRDESAEARRRAVCARALAELGYEPALEPARKLLRDRDSTVAGDGALAVAKLVGSEALAELKPLLPATGPGRASFLKALGTTGNPGAVPILVSSLPGPYRDGYAVLRALGDMRCPESEAALVAIITDPTWRPWVREEATQRLQASAASAAEALYRAAVARGDDTVQRAAVQALRKVGDRPRLTDVLVRLTARWLSSAGPGGRPRPSNLKVDIPLIDDVWRHGDPLPPRTALALCRWRRAWWPGVPAVQTAMAVSSVGPLALPGGGPLPPPAAARPVPRPGS